MKHIVLLAAMFLAGTALAQAPAPKPAAEAPKPAAEAAKPPAAAPAVTAASTAAPAPTAEAPKPMRKTRRSEDARKCLEEPNNNAIIKCAEAYL